MGYATVADMRGEGVTEAMASDARLCALIEEASRVVDHHAGWFFDARQQTFHLDGRGTPTVEPPIPPIALSRLAVGGSDLSLHPDDLLVVGSPVAPDFHAPRITLRHGRRFPKGSGNVEVEGLCGYTEPDGTPHGRTPLEIRRATMLLVLRLLPPLGDVETASDARSRWRIIEERTRDQSYKLAPDSRAAPLSGDPEVDAILARYRRPPGLGAA